MAFDTSHIENLPEGLDPEIVKKTHRGKGWGAQDQKRYDREVAGNRGTTKAQRAENFKNQKIQSAKDFNFDQHGKGHVSQQEVRFLRQTNKNDKGGTRLNDNIAALEQQKAAGADFSRRADSQLDRMYGRRDKIQARQEAKERAQNAGGGSGNTNGSGTQVVGDGNVVGDDNVVGNDNQVGDGNVRVESGRDSNIGDASGSHTVGDNNSGVVGNKNATVDNQVDASQRLDFTQDNDQNSNVQGDNNYVYQNQDNSVRNYGGDNRSFVYNTSGGDGLTDTPVSAATMGGFYDVDDSPAATAMRHDLHSTLNRDAQKKYANTSHIAQGAIARAEQNQYIDPNKMDQRIAARSQYHKDQSTIKGGQIFGDLFGMSGPTWNSAEPANPVEKPDFDKMYNKYSDF